MYITPKKISWLGLLFKLQGSVLLRIWPRMLFVTVIALVNTALRESFGFFQGSLTTTPFVLIGLPLGVFLGFRNGASYDRFWEGRKLWGSFTNTARSVTRQILTLVHPQRDGIPTPSSEITGDEAEAIATYKREMVYRVAAFIHASRVSLRDSRDFRTTEPLLPEGEFAAFDRARNVPMAHLLRMGERVRDAWHRGWLHPLHVPTLEASLVALTDVQGACERIHTTPLPFSYTVLIHRIVAIYCLLLPFGVVETIHWMTPLVVLFISYAFFGLDQIGDEIEDPFGTDVNDLPLSAISTNIEITLREHLGESPLPDAPKPRRGVLS